MNTLSNKIDGYLTYEDYCQFPENERWELINGHAFNMTPAPSRYHQDILRNLFLKIGTFLENKPCKFYCAPFDVRFYDSIDQPDSKIATVVQPDLIVICDQSKLDDKGCRGAPDLIIEITSPESLSRDLKTKLNLYQKHGVKEYWIVNQSDKTVTLFNNNVNGQFRSHREYRSQEVIESEVLNGLCICADMVFR